MTSKAAEAARSRRSRLIVLATLSTSASRFVGIGATLMQVPLALHFLGGEAFGLWMTVVGTIQLMSFADLGLGLGLQNRISTAYGQDDTLEIRSLHYTGRRLLGLIGVVVTLVCWPICLLVPWATIFNVHSQQLAQQLPYALMAVVGAFAVGLPLNAGARLATGIQLGWLTGVSTMFSSGMTLLVVGIAGYTRLPFAAFVGATVVPPLLANFGVGWQALRTLAPLPDGARPRFRRDVVGSIVKQGILFLVPQVCSSIMVAAPSLAIASSLGPAAVTPFSIAQRLANVSVQLLQLPLNPLWPAYAEARSRGDWTWIATAFKRSLVFSGVGGSMAGLGMVFLGQHVILLWTGKPGAVPDQLLLVGFGVWVAVIGLFSAVTMLLNGSGRLRGQALGGVASCVLLLVSLPSLISHLSIAGAAFAMIGSWMLGAIPFLSQDLKRAWPRS